jgi:hypothetical protein
LTALRGRTNGYLAGCLADGDAAYASSLDVRIVAMHLIDRPEAAIEQPDD